MAHVWAEDVALRGRRFCSMFSLGVFVCWALAVLACNVFQMNALDAAESGQSSDVMFPVSLPQLQHSCLF